MAGAVRILLGICRGGTLLTLLPPTVLDGFTLGAVWLVFTTQFPAVTGMAAPHGMHYVQAAFYILVRPLEWDLGALWARFFLFACFSTLDAILHTHGDGRRVWISPARRRVIPAGGVRNDCLPPGRKEDQPSFPGRPCRSGSGCAKAPRHPSFIALLK